MSVALRTITRLQDADDINVSLGAGVDEYALCWDNDTAKFVLRAPVAAPDLSGYALLAGRAGGQTLYGGTAANDDITIHGTSDGTRTTSYVILQPTAGNVGIGTTAPGYKLDIVGTQRLTNNAGDVFVLSGNSTANYTDIKQTGQGLDIFLYNFGTTYSTSGRYVAASALYDAGGSGGLGLAASHASGVIRFYTNGDNERMRILATGNVGIGTTAPATMLHAVSTTATTNAVANVLTLGANVTSTGVGAAGLGAAVLFTMETTTTTDTSAASVQAIIYEATHATRKFDLVLNAYDTAIREGLRIRGDGSGPAIGFYGVAPIARAILATGAGATVDNIITALQNLGLVKQS
jgi:hypothetical protein